MANTPTKQADTKEHFIQNGLFPYFKNKTGPGHVLIQDLCRPRSFRCLQSKCVSADAKKLEF